MLAVDFSSNFVFVGTGVAVVMALGIVALCAGFKRKHKKTFNLPPVRLIFKHEDVQYSEPNAPVGIINGHLAGDSFRNNQLRPHSPTWRNSSLSRELPAIPDVPENAGGRDLTRYESASNLYACLDDVRVREAADPQSSDSSRETSFPAPHSTTRIHPYDRIGGPSTSAVVISTSQPSTSTATAHNHNHAQILQQMDNDTTLADYRGEARSDMSYTSITVRAPLANLRTRRSSEDGYTNVHGGDESHLYAQVGGEYGGSVGSEHLGSHIYNELYAEIDAQNSPGTGQLIDPYATSAAVVYPPSSSLLADSTYSNLPSTSHSNQPVLLPDEIDKLYAKINKPSRGSQKKSFLETSMKIPSVSRTQPNGPDGWKPNEFQQNAIDQGGEGSSRNESLADTRMTLVSRSISMRNSSEPLVVRPDNEDSVGGVTRVRVGNTHSLNDIKASVDAAISSMDSSLSGFLKNGENTSSSGTGWANGYKRRDHVYEQLPDL